MEYNTQRSDLKLKEYGRNVQKIVEFVIDIEDREKKNAYAYGLIQLMKQLNPSIKENLDLQQRLWDHLFIMSDFKLEVDSPYPKPNEDILINKPEPLKYKNSNMKYRHYGRNIEIMIQEAKKMEDKEKQIGAYIHIAKLMKGFYASWNRELIDDKIIINNIKHIAGEDIPIEKLVAENPNLIRVESQNNNNSRNNSSNNSRNNNSNNSSNKRRWKRR